MIPMKNEQLDGFHLVTNEDDCEHMDCMILHQYHI